MMWAYLVRCADGSLYAGWTTEPQKRIDTHNSGKGAKYTRARLPVRLAYAQGYETRSEAMTQEAKLKRMSKAQKEALVAQWEKENAQGYEQCADTQKQKTAEDAPKTEEVSERLRTEISAALQENPHKIVFSLPRGERFRRAHIVRVGEGWQMERLSEKQAFHQNFAQGELLAQAVRLMEDFSQLTAFSAQKETRIKLSKKGKVLRSSSAVKGAKEPKASGDSAVKRETAPHDRTKRAPLEQGVPVPALIDMGILAKDGRPIAAKRDKLRQVNRFLELIEDALKDTLPEIKKGQGEDFALNIVDFGCGKSALTFVLYHYLNEVRGTPVHMTGLDLKSDVVANCNAAAERYGYKNLHFQTGDIAGHTAQERVHMMVSLHACDVATDYALAKAVKWGAPLIFSVPCCQHELNAAMQSEELAILTRYGVVKERTAALMTDAIRANLLMACGYKAQLVEFVGFEHTPKNIMIRAVKTSHSISTKRRALSEVLRLMQAFGVQPTLYKLLSQEGVLSGI